MSEQIIKIENYEPKISKNNKAYGKVNNKFSVFEKDLMRKCEDNVNKTFFMEIAVNGDFSNIRGIGEETDKAPEVIKVPEVVKQEEGLVETLDKEKIKAQIIVLIAQL